MRGSISYIAQRHIKTNDRYMKCYDSSKESKYIAYLDASSLYGWAMKQPLPYGGFKWLNKKEIDKFDENSTDENSSIGYTLEVDFEYPNDFYDLHNDYPLAPEKLEISQNMLSKYCFNIKNEYGIKIGGVKKVVPNLSSKSKYVVHYKIFQLYVSLGMELAKIHRVLKIKQFDLLKKFVDFNTDKIKNSANDFEEMFLNIMSNSVFGKGMESLRKRISVKLINNAKDHVKCINKPSFVSQEIVSKNVVAIHKIKPFWALNKPIYVGFTILDLIKWLMYNFHTNTLKINLMRNCCLLIQTV